MKSRLASTNKRTSICTLAFYVATKSLKINLMQQTSTATLDGKNILSRRKLVLHKALTKIALRGAREEMGRTPMACI
jgi:hypothetical protein